DQAPRGSRPAPRPEPARRQRPSRRAPPRRAAHVLASRPPCALPTHTAGHQHHRCQQRPPACEANQPRVAPAAVLLAGNDQADRPPDRTIGGTVTDLTAKVRGLLDDANYAHLATILPGVAPHTVRV